VVQTLMPVRSPKCIQFFLFVNDVRLFVGKKQPACRSWIKAATPAVSRKLVKYSRLFSAFVFGRI
jgi:hypothetical protein